MDDTRLEPGAKLTFAATLHEYDVPVEGRAEVTAQVGLPGGASVTVPLVPSAPGMFEASLEATLAGVYTVRFVSTGVTLHGRPFRREQTATGLTFRGGDRPRIPQNESPRGSAASREPLDREVGEATASLALQPAKIRAAVEQLRRLERARSFAGIAKVEIPAAAPLAERALPRRERERLPMFPSMEQVMGAAVEPAPDGGAHGHESRARKSGNARKPGNARKSGKKKSKK